MVSPPLVLVPKDQPPIDPCRAIIANALTVAAATYIINSRAPEKCRRRGGFQNTTAPGGAPEAAG